MYPCRFAPGVTRAAVCPRGAFALGRVVAVLDGGDAESLSGETLRTAASLDLILFADGREILRMPLSSALSVSYEPALDEDDEPILQRDGSPELVRVHGLRVGRALFADEIALRLEGALPAAWDVSILLRGTETAD